MTDASPAYIASDVHLGAVPPEVETAFIGWLEFVAGRSRHVVLNGDLFDFWFEYRSGFPPGHDRVLAALRRVVDAGVRVDFFGGNHDWWGGRHLRDEIGLRLHFEPRRMEVAGRRAWIGHGDGQGPGDWGYKALSAVIRNPLFVAGFRSLPPSWGDRIASRVSSTEGKWRPPQGREFANSERLRKWGTGVLSTDDSLDLLAVGHTHVPVLEEVGTDRWYVNTGDWVYHRSYLRVDPGRPPAMYGWDGSPLEEREPR